MFFEIGNFTVNLGWRLDRHLGRPCRRGYGLDDFAAGDVASGRGRAAAGSVTRRFEQAVAADAATDRDLKQRQAGEAAAVVLVGDFFYD